MTTPSQSAFEWDDVLHRETRPSYFRGVVEHGDWKVPISHLRSWQHKESRRSQVYKLAQCVMLQASGGYVMEPLRYFVNTIFAEDIGVAQPALLDKLFACFFKWHTHFKTLKPKWPMTPQNFHQLLQDLYNTCEVVADSPKSRFVPSWATLAVLSHVGNWSADEAWPPRLARFRVALTTCLSVPLNRTQITPDDERLEPLMIALEDCLLYLAYAKKHKVKQPRPGFRAQLWGVILGARLPLRDSVLDLKADTLASAQNLDKLIPGRLIIYFATLYRAMSLSHTGPCRDTEVTVGLDPDQLREQLFPAPGLLPLVPEYALDKHVGRGGGYQKFQTEGIRVPPEHHWCAEADTSLSDRSFRQRFLREAKHGSGSSKTAKVYALILKAAAAASSLTDLVEEKEHKGQKRKSSPGPAPADPKSKTRRKAPVSMTPTLEAPVAQVVTGRHKKYVYVYPKVVKKGPYFWDQPGDVARVRRNMTVPSGFDTFHKAQGVPTTVLNPGGESTDDGKATYLFWDNVGDFADLTTERRSTKLAQDVKVVTRGSMVKRVSDVPIVQLSDRVIMGCLHHLYARYVLGIGDSGPWNVLIADCKVGADGKLDGRSVGVDLEELRNFKTLPQSKLQMLFSKPTRQAQQLVPYLSRIKQIDLVWAKKNLEPEMFVRARNFIQAPPS